MFGHERGFLILRIVGVTGHALPKVTRGPAVTFAATRSDPTVGRSERAGPE